MEDLVIEYIANVHSPSPMEQSADERHSPNPAELDFKEVSCIFSRDEAYTSPMIGIHSHSPKDTEDEEFVSVELPAPIAELHSPSLDAQVLFLDAENGVEGISRAPHTEEVIASEMSFVGVEHSVSLILDEEEALNPEHAAPLSQEGREASSPSAQGEAEPTYGDTKEGADHDPLHVVGSDGFDEPEIAMTEDKAEVPCDEVPEEVVESAGEDLEAAGSAAADVASENEFSVAIDEKRRGERKRKRGRPITKVQGTRLPFRRKVEEEVCFICFDGGDLVVCDRRGCPKVYHPSCVNREESYFQSKGQWSCGWHLCSKCQKSASYMCYTCTHSLCKVCVNEAEFTCIRGKKGFCPSCMSTVLLLETSENAVLKEDGVDFNDQNCWEYLFKDYWLELKGKLSINLNELIKAQTMSNVYDLNHVNEESSDDEHGVSSDRSSTCNDESFSSKTKHKLSRGAACDIPLEEQTEGVLPYGTSFSRKQTKKSSRNASLDSLIERKADVSTVLQEDSLITREKKRLRKSADEEAQTDLKGEVSVRKKKTSLKRLRNVDKELTASEGNANWASKELLAFVSHVKNGDQSILSHYDVQELLLNYIKANNLRDPRKRSQIICDKMLLSLFDKSRVGHFEMLKLLESHFLIKASSSASDGKQGDVEDYIEIENEASNDFNADSRKMVLKRAERERQADFYDYAAVDADNINLMYLRRSLMEDLLDNMSTFSGTVIGSFVRIRVTGSQRQEVYRLVQVIGCGRAPEEYKTGKRMTDVILEIINLDKKEVITVDIISNQDFTKEECKRLRQSIKFGFICRLTVGEVQEKARVLQAVRVIDHLESEKLRLIHLRDRASEKGRKKEHRECVEKLQLLSSPEEQIKRLNELPKVHTDSKMDPNYESPEDDGDDRIKEAGNPLQSTLKKVLISPQKEGGVYWSGASNSSNNTIASEPRPTLASIVNELPSQKHDVESISNFHKVESKLDEKSVVPLREMVVQSEMKLTVSLAKAEPSSNANETDKLWHYKDPSGKIQGPFSIVQLKKWSKHFPSNLGIWRKSERQEDSILLTDALSGNYKKDLPDLISAQICHPSQSKQQGNYATAQSSMGLHLATANVTPQNNNAASIADLSSNSGSKHDAGSNDCHKISQLEHAVANAVNFESSQSASNQPIIPFETDLKRLSEQSSMASKKCTFPVKTDDEISELERHAIQNCDEGVLFNSVNFINQRNVLLTERPTDLCASKTEPNPVPETSGTFLMTGMHSANECEPTLLQNAQPAPLVPSNNWNLPDNVKSREQSAPSLNSSTSLSGVIPGINSMPSSTDASKQFILPQVNNHTSANTVPFQQPNMSWGAQEVCNSGWQFPNQYQSFNNIAATVGTTNHGWGMVAHGNMNMPWVAPPNANMAWIQGPAMLPQGNGPSNFVWGPPQGSTIPSDACQPPALINNASYPMWNPAMQGCSNQTPIWPTQVVGTMNQSSWGIANQSHVGAVNIPGAHDSKNSAWKSPKAEFMQKDKFRERNFGPRNGGFRGAGSGHNGPGRQPRNWNADGPGICKYYENGHCRNGASCSYIHS